MAIPSDDTMKPKTVFLGFASYQDGKYELIVEDSETGEQDTLEGQLRPGQLEKIYSILPTCVMVRAGFDNANGRLLRAVEHYAHHLARRARRSENFPHDAVSLELDALRPLAEMVRREAGVERALRFPPTWPKAAARLNSERP
jgi:hypothetical protein